MKLRHQRDGRTFDLKDLNRIGSGGEAIVYELKGTPWAVKVYSKRVNGRDDKLRVMLANPPKDPTSAQGHVSIAWPQDLLIDPHDRIVGYVMPRVEQMRRMFDFYNPGTRRKKCPLFTYKYLVATALNLAIAVRALHQRGYVMGDVNESNFLVADNTMVTLVDTDSFQVREPGNGKIHHCTVASPLFTPREMQGVDFTIAERREEQDLFGLGVLLFQLLMEGSHPFQARFTGAGDSPEPIEMIQHGNFPHGTGSAMWQPPPAAPAYGMLDPKLRSLFTRCFVNGHSDPIARPTANEWCANLNETLGILIHCKVNPSHLHWPHVTRCPWCERKEKLGGRDPFPCPDQVRSGAHLARAATSKQIPVSEPARPSIPTPSSPAKAPIINPVSRPVQNPSASSPLRPAAVAAPSPVLPWWKRIIGGGSPTHASKPLVAPVPQPTSPVQMPAAPPRAKLLAGANSTELGQVFIGDLRAADIGSGTILELCGIPAGSFTMGGLGPTETLHRVTLTKPFWMGLTQVTVGQWQALFRTKPNSGLSLPITDVSWNEALEFCDKLNSKNILPAGWEWTLPTEAQWEYACRAGTTGDFAGMLDEMAWYSANAARNPHPIAKKKPNAWGLYDMHGNVWEWCADYYGSYLSAPVTDPTGPKSGNARVNRGGGFCDTAEACRSARRDSNGPGCQSRALGFRVAIVTKIY